MFQRGESLYESIDIITIIISVVAIIIIIMICSSMIVSIIISGISMLPLFAVPLLYLVQTLIIRPISGPGFWIAEGLTQAES